MNIQEQVKEVKDAIASLRKLTNKGVEFEDKDQLYALSAEMYMVVQQIPVTNKTCANCVFCSKNKAGDTCCIQRDMRPIPFEVVNRCGGCSKWKEGDSVPF